MTDYQKDLSILQSLFSPAFPIGGFSYSGGLESAINMGLIKDRNSLQDWIFFVLTQGGGRNDALFIKEAYHGKDSNALCLSLAAGKERHQEMIELGAAFTRIVNSSYGLALPDGLAYPISVGVAASQFNLDLGLTIQSYLQSFASNLISVAVRSIPIGQTAGQTCLFNLIPAFINVKDEVIVSTLDDLGSAALISDVMSIRHETDLMRIYRT